MVGWGREVFSTAHLLWVAARARFHHHTATNCCPDTDHKLSNAENQYDGTDCHFANIHPFFQVVEDIVIIVIIKTTTCKVYLQAIKKDDYSTHHCRSDGETHEHSSLKSEEKQNINATTHH